ncbi:MAG: AAA family ATPase [Planctomycetes bacterium]|nr:AAA family ATPase [Planctomycetota bacterium]
MRRDRGFCKTMAEYMTALSQNLRQIWDQLRGQKASREDYLDQVRIQKLRGIQDLRVALPFPVCVLAGANGCGKTTVLLALACAYRPPSPEWDAEPVTNTPAKLFPDFRPKGDPTLSDSPGRAEIEYSYTSKGQSLSMAWKRGAGKWSRSFFGRKRGEQPVRTVYLHTLSKLTNPSEVRSVIQLAQRAFTSADVDASDIGFAQRILGFKYARLAVVKHGKRNLLVADRSDVTGDAVRYSEFHMSAGERAVIRLSMSLSKMESVLVLVDEVEAGLHPQVQQMLMLELQRLALRNRIQIVCTTHSPAVLDTVPMEARVFLERDGDNVKRREAFRDIIQKTLYGRSQNVLSFLCEDAESEALVRGVLDFLGPKLDFLQNDIEVGRDTGKDQFPAHMETLARFRRLGDVVFVLDGDGQDVKQRMERRAEELGQRVRVICLPGGEIPETWAWALLEKSAEKYAEYFGLDAAGLRAKIRAWDGVFSAAADKPAAISKNKMATLADEHSRSMPDLFRHLAKSEAAPKGGSVFELAVSLEDTIRNWRATRD